MMRIGITGADGFLGWHLRAYLHGKGVVPTCTGRDVFAQADRLVDFVRQCDAIVHLAGMNRGDDETIEQINVSLATQLVSACSLGGVRPHIVFSNSTHISRDTAYARSKRRAAAVLQEWADAQGARFTNMVLPQIFGECGRPFYNSAAATFCHQLAHGEAPKLIQDAPLELLHAQRAAEHIVASLEGENTGVIRIPGRAITVAELLARLSSFAATYGAQLIPQLDDQFALELFNTYRSHLFPRHYPVSLQLREDQRGALFEAVKSLHGGQCFISSTLPGFTRGKHYHRYKVERFLVVRGEAMIRVRRLQFSDVTEYRVSGTAPQYIDMPTLHTHDITNVGTGELITLFWSHDIFDPANTDTYAEPVLRGPQ